MKHLFLMMVMSFGFSNAAFAKQALQRGCSLRATVSGLDAAAISEGTTMLGEGTLVCKNPVSGNLEYQRVGVLLDGAGIGPQFNLPALEAARLNIEAVDASITRHDSVYGEYQLDRGLKLRRLSEQPETGVAVSARGVRGSNVDVKIKLLSRESFGLGGEFAIEGMAVMPIQEFEAYKNRQQMARLRN